MSQWANLVLSLLKDKCRFWCNQSRHHVRIHMLGQDEWAGEWTQVHQRTSETFLKAMKVCSSRVSTSDVCLTPTQFIMMRNKLSSTEETKRWVNSPLLSSDISIITKEFNLNLLLKCFSEFHNFLHLRVIFHFWHWVRRVKLIWFTTPCSCSQLSYLGFRFLLSGFSFLVTHERFQVLWNFRLVLFLFKYFLLKSFDIGLLGGGSRRF